ncbi:hypothetical protein R1flu_026175 [Riccia fluitans]|uniref:Uncharacterized protein n=1 Tax=Riccia fluitans TaxID=41844 RepID=A0ABD1XF78_9MARC
MLSSNLEDGSHCCRLVWDPPYFFRVSSVEGQRGRDEVAKLQPQLSFNVEKRLKKSFFSTLQVRTSEVFPFLSVVVNSESFSRRGASRERTTERQLYSRLVSRLKAIEA